MAQVRFLIWNTVTSTVVNDNFYMDSENLPIPGLNPDYEAFIFYTPQQPAPIDVERMKLIITYTMTTTPHPLYPAYNQYLVTYSEEPRPDSELIIAVTNRCRAANQLIFNGYNMDEINSIRISLVDKKGKKDTLEPWELEMVALGDEISAKIQNNENLKLSKIEAINNSEEWMLDDGWIEA